MEDRVRIAPGTSEDIDAVMQVMNSAFGDAFGEAWTRSQLAGILPMTGVSLVLARDAVQDCAVGFTLTRTVADESELLLIGVVPDRHREGIGRRLLGQFLDHARAVEVTRAHLEVREGNPAITMYSAVGFKPVGRRRNYYQGKDGIRFDAITLAIQVESATRLVP